MQEDDADFKQRNDYSYNGSPDAEKQSHSRDSSKRMQDEWYVLRGFLQMRERTK